jgi:hypothetical protein
MGRNGCRRVTSAVVFAGWLLLGLGLAPGVQADQLAVTVTDGQTGLALAGAFVLVGPSASNPFAGNYGWTNAQGQITFSDPSLTGPQTVTAALETYGNTTVYQAAVGSIGLPLYPAVLDSTMGGTITHVEGTVQNIAITNNDGNLDVALVLPAVTASDFALGDRLPFSFGMETITLPIIGDIELPENSYAPDQIELLFYHFQKSPWRIDVPGQRATTFVSVAGRIALDALIAGATMDDVEIREMGVERDVYVGGPMNVTINSDLNLTRNLTTVFSGVPAGAVIEAVSGARIPTAGGEVIVSYAANEAGIDTVSSFLLASRLPGGDLSDAVNVAVGRYGDSSGEYLFGAGIMQRNGFTLPHTETFQTWMSIPDLVQNGRTLSWSDPTAPGVSPAPTWTRSVVGLRPLPGQPGVTTRAWRIFAPASGAGAITLPVLPAVAPGPPTGLPDPSQTPEADQLYWDLQAANPPGGPGAVVAGFLEGATHWSQHWIPIDVPVAAVGDGHGQVADGLQLRAMPNPSPGVVALSWRAGESGPARLEIITLDGRCVHAQAIDLGRGGAGWNGLVDEQPAPSGCYWALVRRDGRLLGRAPLLRIE